MSNSCYLMCWMYLNGYFFFFDGVLMTQGHLLRWITLMIFLSELNMYEVKLYVYKHTSRFHEQHSKTNTGFMICSIHD